MAFKTETEAKEYLRSLRSPARDRDTVYLWATTTHTPKRWVWAASAAEARRILDAKIGGPGSGGIGPVRLARGSGIDGAETGLTRKEARGIAF